MGYKGDWSRVKDYKAFNDNWDRIFGNEEPTKEDTHQSTQHPSEPEGGVQHTSDNGKDSQG